MATSSYARDKVLWEAVKEHIYAPFLHIDEASALTKPEQDPYMCLCQRIK